MSTVLCNVCQSADVEHDAVAGTIVCNGCGTVLEENTIVSEIQFSESATGSSVLQGTFYSEKGRPPPTSLFGSKRFFQSDSREWTLSVAKSRIQALAYAVQLNDHHIDAAHRWYILALQHNFTRGRRAQSIAAACLYMVCRQEKTPHMLLDFSDVLQTNVYELGNCYLKLCRLLSVDLPLIDPSLYIGRFASRLEFGDKTNIVANTALRLVSRMKRDWIQTGRRPSGICGACLLIASRLYGFSRTQKEIIAVVRICEMTLKRRLEEFAQTPSSKLTPEEFHGVWLEHEADPPAFTRNKMKEIYEKPKGPTYDEIIAAKLCQVITESYDDSTLDNDREVSDSLLSLDEIDVKTKMWIEENKDYLEAQEQKLLQLKEQEKMGILKPTKKRKRREPKPLTESYGSAGEASRKIIETKKFSKKFNYDALDSLLESQPVLQLASFIEQAS